MKMVLVFLGALFVSCGVSRFGGKEAPLQRPDGRSYNEEFDPVPLDPEIIVLPRHEEEVKETARDPVTVPQTPEAEGLEMTQGFRVQLLSGKDAEAAMEAKRRAIFMFEESVYLDFESPYYKLRVGDCLNREEAELLRRKAQRNGFSNPWIVPSRVFRKKDQHPDG